jgi:hypothetical protein
MEELSDSRYEKGTDSVEKYLLNIVQSYFKNQTISSAQSRETIIKRAVARMKEEVDFESIGVLSITLPDGQKLIGAVQLSLADLNGEPIIKDKKTAFNVDFGKEAGTACEGNDPRLSDSRKPLAHSHDISDVLNLSAELTALQGKINRLVFHDHSNSDALNVVRYTGTKPVVDLAEVEKLQEQLKTLLSDMQSVVDAYKDDTKGAVADAKDGVQSAMRKFSQLQSGLSDQGSQYYSQLETEIGTKITAAYNQLDAKFDDYASATAVSDLQGLVTNAITAYDTTTVYMADVVAAGGTYKIDDGIPLAIHSLGANAEPIIDAYILVGGVKTKMPYFVFNKNTYVFDGSISVAYDGKDTYVMCSITDNIPADLLNASIQVVYSVKGV